MYVLFLWRTAAVTETVTERLTAAAAVHAVGATNTTFPEIKQRSDMKNVAACFQGEDKWRQSSLLGIC